MHIYIYIPYSTHICLFQSLFTSTLLLLGSSPKNLGEVKSSFLVLPWCCQISAFLVSRFPLGWIDWLDKNPQQSRTTRSWYGIKEPRLQLTSVRWFLEAARPPKTNCEAWGFADVQPWSKYQTCISPHSKCWLSVWRIPTVCPCHATYRCHMRTLRHPWADAGDRQPRRTGGDRPMGRARPMWIGVLKTSAEDCIKQHECRAVNACVHIFIHILSNIIDIIIEIVRIYIYILIWCHYAYHYNCYYIYIYFSIVCIIVFACVCVYCM